jgi:hypothetical protein
MLSKGNSKLGRSIWCFSIPAGASCPGKSDLCSERCYAQKGFFVMPSVRKSQQTNWEASRMKDFPERMIEEIRKKKCAIVRIHVAGDLYSAEYTKKWHKIVKACPDVRFFIYTRSWRIPKIREAIDAFVKDCPNLRMWFSVDAEIAPELKNVPKRVRRAYMTVANNDIPSNKMDLVFRDYAIRNSVQKKVNGVLVCPPENGITKLNCETCGICWERTTVPKGPPDPALKGRISLQLAA